MKTKLLHPSRDLNKKIERSVELIKLWVDFCNGPENTYVAFSGGIDSTVLLDLVRKVYPKVSGCFLNTLIELPETYQFIRSFENIDWLKPTKTFQKVIVENGWPVISKKQASNIENEQRHWGNRNLYKISLKHRYLINAPFKISDTCCQYLKKRPAHKYTKTTGKLPFIGILSEESNMRQKETECNLYTIKHPQSRPLLKWTKNDIWTYIYQEKLKYNPLYDMGMVSTGCAYCLFGIHLQKPENNIQLLERINPKMHNYFLYKLGGKEVMEFLKVSYTKRNFLFDMNS